MRKYYFLILLISLILTGCNPKNIVKGEYDLKGIVLQVDENTKRILVDDDEMGLVWVTLNDNEDIEKFEAYQDVVIWIKDGIKESYPAQARASHAEIIEPEESAITTRAETQKGDFIYRLITEKAEYKENEPLKMYAEMEYVGDQEEITIFHASSVFHFPMIEKNRNFTIDYVMTQPLATTILKKGEVIKGQYNGSGAYSEEDDREYKEFMKRVMDNQFPAGDYLVAGFADFYTETKSGEKKNYKIRGKIAFKVNE